MHKIRLPKICETENPGSAGHSIGDPKRSKKSAISNPLKYVSSSQAMQSGTDPFSLKYVDMLSKKRIWTLADELAGPAFMVRGNELEDRSVC